LTNSKICQNKKEIVTDTPLRQTLHIQLAALEKESQVATQKIAKLLDKNCDNNPSSAQDICIQVALIFLHLGAYDQAQTTISTIKNREDIREIVQIASLLRGSTDALCPVDFKEIYNRINSLPDCFYRHLLMAEYHYRTSRNNYDASGAWKNCRAELSQASSPGLLEQIEVALLAGLVDFIRDQEPDTSLKSKLAQSGLTDSGQIGWLCHLHLAWGYLHQPFQDKVVTVGNVSMTEYPVPTIWDRLDTKFVELAVFQSRRDVRSARCRLNELASCNDARFPYLSLLKARQLRLENCPAQAKAIYQNFHVLPNFVVASCSKY
jgi:hypothetical protein